jgi:hypothetical protein
MHCVPVNLHSGTFPGARTLYALGMRAVRSSVPARHQRRLCLTCGFDGPPLQHYREDAPEACPNCGEDLYARPPRSYAELEGLDEAFEIDPTDRGEPLVHATPIRRLIRLLRRWLRSPR